VSWAEGIGSDGRATCATACAPELTRVQLAHEPGPGELFYMTIDY